MSLIFRLIRLVALCLVAFVAGIFFERGHQQDLGEAAGGHWARAGVCAVEVSNG